MKPRRSPRVRQQRNSAGVSSDESMGSDGSLSTSTNKLAQLKLTDMLNQMKKPSVPKKVEVFLLRNETAHEKNVLASPEKNMTQQMIALLDDVEIKHQGGKSETETEDDSMESGLKTSISKWSERRQTLTQVRRVLEKVSEYLGEEERSSFVLWWSNNAQVFTGINGTEVDKDRLVVTYLSKDSREAQRTIKHIRCIIAK